MFWRTLTIGIVIGGLISKLLSVAYNAIKNSAEVIAIMDEWMYRFWDYAVLEVINTRKFWDVPNTDPDTGMTPSLSQEPAPYSVQEIAVKLHRKPKRVLSSLKRLKRTEKAIETPQGWFSKARFPQNYYSN